MPSIFQLKNEIVLEEFLIKKWMINPKIDDILKKLEKQEIFERENPEKVVHSEKMLAITRDLGLFYNIFLRSANVKKILEIGTSTGYSTIWFADAIREKNEGEIITIEKDQEKINRAENNFEEAGLRNLIEIKKGDALDIIKELNQEEKNFKKFDFVFIDADKERYIQYFDNVIPLLKRGGLIGADNIIWPERFSGYIKPYLDHVKNHPKFLSTTIPIDNGEEISIKIED